MNDIRIAHFSDIHNALFPARTDWNINRFFSWMSWLCLRKRHHSLMRLNWVLDKIIEIHPDAVIITGDLGHTGLEEEIHAVSALLDRITQKKIPILLAGGNHDIYDNSTSSLKVYSEVKKKHCLNMTMDQDGICRLGDLTLLVLEQMIANPFFLARGRSENRVLESVATRLQKKEFPQISLAAGHYPVIDRRNKPLSFRRGLIGSEPLKQFLVGQHIPAYLCGHCHRPFTTYLSPDCTQYCAGSITNAGFLRVLHFDKGQFIKEETYCPPRQ